MTAEQLWNQYLDTLQSEQASALTYTAWHFDDNEKAADALVKLVLSGEKKGTSSNLWVYEKKGEVIPQVEELSVILNWQGEAKCIIQTVNIEIIPYEDITEEFAAMEGEGDKSLAYWKSVHKPFFTRECARVGVVFDDSMSVICETFDVVYKI